MRREISSLHLKPPQSKQDSECEASKSDATRDPSQAINVFDAFKTELSLAKGYEVLVGK
jgi:hypothetical protein